ncbi:MAG: stalk domain-containing protein [Bacillota bacterium]|nr:stalk domain-containing protein [Bacillota bacterium]
MKKLKCGILALAIALSMLQAMCISAETKTYTPADIAEKGGTISTTATQISNWQMNGYISFKSVDMTGVKSVRMNGSCKLDSSTNGDIYCIRTDSLKGDIIGWVKFNEDASKEFAADLDYTVSGTHDIYIVSTFCHANGLITVDSVTFSTEALAYTPYEPVPDSAIIDNYHDTWAAVDDMGRSVADYEEVGDVKKEDRYIGMFYWDWHTGAPDKTARIPSEIVKAHPEAKYTFDSPVWDISGVYYWSQPLFGFYDNTDYWVYRKQAVLLANADVDVVFFDCTNGDQCFYRGLKTQLNAWRDARASGVDAPKISALCSWKTNKANSVKFFYLTMFKDGNYSDLWFYWNGKPLLMSAAYKSSTEKYEDPSDMYYVAFMDEMYNSFTFKSSGGRSGQTDKDQFIWLEDYPQHKFGTYSDGRTEFMSLGCSINESYVWGKSITGVFSDEYTKGRSYTEAFGEDWTENGFRQNSFLKEQESRVLDTDPAFVFVDGWNEWIAGRQRLYSGVTNCFVDTYDNEGSRDIEPSRGPLGDDTYNMFVDFVRKYRGVRPAPTAGAEKTIDINGALNQWDSVAPEFINDDDDYQRDYYGYKNPETGKQYHYTTVVNNSISRAKAARDKDNFYFYVKTTKDIVKGTDNWMNIYINTDRNHATGWQGYDYVINRKGPGIIEKNTGNKWEWEQIGTVSYTVNANVLQVVIPRSFLGETGTVDLEFKVTDGIDVAGDALNLYTNGSCAPMGRFNYLYTQIQQTSTTDTQREALKDSVILKSDSNRMVVNGGKMYVYEPDTRVKAINDNGVLYFPINAVEDILGFGETKFTYDRNENIIHIESHTLNDKDEISDYKWTYTVIGSNEARINGVVKALSNPVKIVNGVIYVPVTYLADCFGWEVYDAGNGITAAGAYGVDRNTVNAVKGLLQ